MSLKVGASETLIPTVTPVDAADKTGTWTIDKPEFAAAVDGKVTAVSAGVAKATFTTTDGSFTAACTITVTAA